ncbi:Carbohydrate esterase family 4 protein [Mycena chlorophos]|uniref:chitin deacetylase n=1 Tax=Mycena chlorophos TaxID=658473 RepID=A0A8H6SKG7_MYCCL|nr:Carbohydrate esterase family 4 protein [Mycena chlorophos]
MRAALTGVLLLAGSFALAQSQTTEAEQAALLGYDAECAPYGIPLTTETGNEFPQLQTMVTVPDVRNDSAAFAKFQSINASIPNIPIKYPGIQYDPNADPDCWWTVSNCVTPKLAGLNMDISAAPEPRTLGYGFDDGPACDHNEFYNFLSAHNQKATMYYIGIYVMWSPLQAQRAAADGHQICVHTWSHGNMTQMTNEEAFGELWYTMKAIKLVTGLTPTCWRPPHGDVDDRIRYIAQQLNLDTIIWRYDSFDWENGLNGVTNATVQNNYDTLINDAKAGKFDTGGAIILTHELNNFTMGMAMSNYPALIDAFDYVVPLAVAMNKTTPYVETNVTFPSFAEFTNQTKSSGSSSSSSSGSSGGSSSSSKGASTNGTNSKATGQSGAVALGPSLTLAVAVAAAVAGAAFSA